jgi:protein involved in polysaccharide export with SLBB domain
MEMIRRIIVLAFAGLVTFSNIQAQEPFYRKSLTNFKVDNLSPDQLNVFQQQLSVSKMSEQDMVRYLLSKGMSIEEINKLKGRMSAQQFLGKNQPNSIDQLGLVDRYLSLKDSLDKQMADSLWYTRSKVEEEIDIFGSELFLNGKLSFVNDMQMATPSNYIIGPKDVLTITLYGYQELSVELRVSPDGKVNIPYAGIVTIGGLSIEQATQKVSLSLQKSGYATLKSGETKLQLSISQYRTFPVTVIGAKSSGTYMVSNVANVFHALHMAGGPSKRGTYRYIELIRKGEIVQYVDLYSFMLEGNQKQFLNLQENDIINIPAYENRVTLKGEIKTPGYFELREGESLEKLLKYCGGFTPIAYKERIYVEKVSTNEFVSRDVERVDYERYLPTTGDVVYVGSIVNRFSRRVAIGGAIMRPGYYAREDSLTIGKLIRRAGGVKESSLLNRGLVFRSGHDHNNSYLRFNPSDVINGKGDILLTDGDSVVIADRAIFFPDKMISVTGEVNNPGLFTYGEKMTVLDALLLGGGLKESSLPNKIEIARRVEQNSSLVISTIIESSTDRSLILQAQELELQPEDVVIVRKNPNYIPQRKIELTGEFRYTGSYILSKQREYLSEVIDRAGGFTELADSRYILVFRKRSNPLYQKALIDKKSEQSLLNIRKSTTKIDDQLEFGKTGGVDNILDNRETKNTSDSLFIDDSEYVTDTISVRYKDLLFKKKTKYDIYLEEGDNVHVMQFRNTVGIEGEVNNKTIVNYSTSSMKSYLRDAGGFTKVADPRRAYLIHADGSSSSTRKFLIFKFHPRVQPGSVVMVPSKLVQNNFTKDPAKLSAMASILASSMGMIIAVLTLLRQ